MQKIASPKELRASLVGIMAYCNQEKPSRVAIAAQLRELAAATEGDFKPKRKHRVVGKTASGFDGDEVERTLGRLPGVNNAVISDYSSPSSGVYDVSVELELGAKESKSVQTRRNGPYARKVTEFSTDLRRVRKAVSDALKKMGAYDVKVSLPKRKSEPKDKDGSGPLKFYDDTSAQVDFFIRQEP